jgi:hypothetical protein
MESIQDIFGRMRTVLPQGRVLNERAELLQWFVQKMQRSPKVIGVRLAHLTLSDLYYLQSDYKDIQRRRGTEAAVKMLWAVTRTTKV